MCRIQILCFFGYLFCLKVKGLGHRLSVSSRQCMLENIGCPPKDINILQIDSKTVELCNVCNKQELLVKSPIDFLALLGYIIWLARNMALLFSQTINISKLVSKPIVGFCLCDAVFWFLREIHVQYETNFSVKNLFSVPFPFHFFVHSLWSEKVPSVQKGTGTMIDFLHSRCAHPPRRGGMDQIQRGHERLLYRTLRR